MRMNRSCALVASLAIAFVLAARPDPVRADDFPQRPINFIVPWGPGGPADIIARALVEQASALLKQPVVILNKPGASGTIGTAELFRSKPDGHTILLADHISTVFQPRRMPLPYRGAEDFQAVIKLTDVPNVLVVAADAKWKSFDEFIADARARPGQIRVATAGRFTGTDLTTLELNRVAGVELANIPTTGGTAQAMTLMLGGHVESAIAAPAAVVGQVAGKKVRPLTVFSKKRSELYPDVPSTTELGYKTTMTSMFYVSAPKDVDKDALRKLHGVLNEVVRSDKFHDFARKAGLQVDPLDPDAMTRELEQWQRYFVNLSRDLGISPAKAN